MENHWTRRRFLKTAGMTASAAMLGPSLFDASEALAATPLVRRDVGGLGINDPILASYRKAVKAMQALPASDPRSWIYQAAIHGTTLSPPKTAWNTCTHGTIFFWSWHRMYLYWFERIARKMSGDPNWALPYWNWSSPSERQLPAAFRDTTSVLYTVNRDPAMNDGTGSLPGTDVSFSAAFAFTSFASANGSIQGTPHGDVHVDIGGWMGSVPTAGQDPIFYLHHCNIDRLWNLWLAQGGGRADPLGDAAWKSTKFTFFDENGTQLQMTGCEVLRAAQQLNYRYEGEPAQVAPICLDFFKPRIFYREIELIRWPGPPVELGPARVSFPLDIKALRQRLMSLAESRTDTVLLAFDEVVSERSPGVVWEVYVGLPANAAPDPKSPFYVGNLSLFGAGVRSEAHHEFQPARFRFAIDSALLAAFRSKEERVSVTFVPHGILVNGKPTQRKVASPVRIGAVSLAAQSESRQ